MVLIQGDITQFSMMNNKMTPVPAFGTGVILCGHYFREVVISRSLPFESASTIILPCSSVLKIQVLHSKHFILLWHVEPDYFNGYAMSAEENQCFCDNFL